MLYIRVASFFIRNSAVLAVLACVVAFGLGIRAAHKAGYEKAESIAVVRRQKEIRELREISDAEIKKLEAGHGKYISGLENEVDHGNTCGLLTDSAIDRLHDTHNARGGQ